MKIPATLSTKSVVIGFLIFITLLTIILGGVGALYMREGHGWEDGEESNQNSMEHGEYKKGWKHHGRESDGENSKSPEQVTPPIMIQNTATGSIPVSSTIASGSLVSTGVTQTGSGTLLTQPKR